MSFKTLHRFLPAALVLGLFFAAVSAWAVDPPSVKRLGQTVSQFKDEKIHVAVSWKYPTFHPDEKWIYIETWAMPAGNAPVGIKREDISLVLPDGTRIKLPDQKSMTNGLPDIRRVLAVGEASRDPMSAYFWARQRLFRMGFHEVPATSIAFSFLGLGSRDAAYGDLFFENPKGKWEKGTYTFEIKSQGIEVKIPIPLGTE